jgi:hypothetical protein
MKIRVASEKRCQSAGCRVGSGHPVIRRPGGVDCLAYAHSRAAGRSGALSRPAWARHGTFPRTPALWSARIGCRLAGRGCVAEARPFGVRPPEPQVRIVRRADHLLDGLPPADLEELVDLRWQGLALRQRRPSGARRQWRSRGRRSGTSRTSHGDLVTRCDAETRPKRRGFPECV